jgi:hypothetical protein
VTQRELYQNELRRLEKARKEAKSGFLKADYGKAIRRMKKDLAIYDYYNGGRK